MELFTELRFSSSLSRARKTSPWPPSPSGFIISHLPTFCMRVLLHPRMSKFRVYRSLGDYKYGLIEDRIVVRPFIAITKQLSMRVLTWDLPPPRSPSFPVSPNYKIPANPFQSHDFPRLNSNDLEMVLIP